MFSREKFYEYGVYIGFFVCLGNDLSFYLIFRVDYSYVEVSCFFVLIIIVFWWENLRNLYLFCFVLLERLLLVYEFFFEDLEREVLVWRIRKMCWWCWMKVCVWVGIYVCVFVYWFCNLVCIVGFWIWYG